MKKSKHKKRNDYRYIKSYKELIAEKSHLAFRARYSEKQLEIRLLEIGYHLHPVRLLPSLITDWAQPLLNELKIRIKEYFFGSRKRKSKRNHRD
ncbi:MAG: hypothetical protein ACOCUL_04450 [Bacteroidota bacterium]